MERWRALAVISEGAPLKIGGLNVWEQKWRDTGVRVELAHPSYPNQLHRFCIYQVGPWWRSTRFAAGELSANVWGFYLPR